MSRVEGQIFCDDCAGWDIEWMYHCKQHGTDYCRGCSCPECEDETWDDYEEDGPQDLETTLDNAVDRAFQETGGGL